MNRAFARIGGTLALATLAAASTGMTSVATASAGTVSAGAAAAAPAGPGAVTGIGYAPSISDPSERAAPSLTQGGSLSSPMTLSYSAGAASPTGSTSTGIGSAAALDDAYGTDSGLPGRHRLHGSVTAVVGSHGMAGTALEPHTASIGNSGVAASLMVSAAHLPSLRIPGGGRVDGGNTQSANLALDKDFGNGTHLGLSFGYARLGNSPYGVYGPYGAPYGYGPVVAPGIGLP